MAGEYDLITNFDNLFSRGGSPAFNDAFSGIGSPSLSPIPDLSSALTGGSGGFDGARANSLFNAYKAAGGDTSNFSFGNDGSIMGPTLKTGGAVDKAAGAAGDATDPNRGLGFNIPTLQLGFGALNSIGNLYAAFQSNALAKKQFNFQKNAYNQNLTNSIQSYNTALADRARSRAVMEGQTDAQRDAYVSENSLKKI